MAGKDYYVILGVPRTASLRSIRDAYRNLAKELHPDVAGPQGNQAFQEINEAYEVLSDPAMRRAHNHELWQAEPIEAGTRIRPGPSPVPEPIPILRRPARPEGLDLEVVLSLREAFEGGVLPVAVPAPRTCPACNGTGREWLFPCLRCGARGRIEVRDVVEVRIPPRVRQGTILDVRLDPVGIRNLSLRLHVVIE